MTEPCIFVGHIAIEVGPNRVFRNAARFAMAYVLSTSGCGKRGIFGAGARKELVLPNNFLRDKGQEFLGKLRIEITDRREISQTTDLLTLPTGIASG
jgi:hypothetical protein